MGLYIGRGAFRVRFTTRGARFSVGTRKARFHFGAGGEGVSTGAGPISYYHPFLTKPKPLAKCRCGRWAKNHRADSCCTQCARVLDSHTQSCDARQEHERL